SAHTRSPGGTSVPPGLFPFKEQEPYRKSEPRSARFCALDRPICRQRIVMPLSRRPRVKPEPKRGPRAAIERAPGGPRVMWVALLAAAFVAYLPALWNGFTFDDRVVISDADYLL